MPRKCKCDIRTKLVGDGCQVCNPEKAAELVAKPKRLAGTKSRRTCKHFHKIVKHPWNKGKFKGAITQLLGYGCTSTLEDGSRKAIVFFDHVGGPCELHERMS